MLTLLPSGSYLTHVLVRAGVYRFVRHLPYGVVVGGLVLVVALVLGRWVLRMRHRHLIRKVERRRVSAR